MKTKKNIGTSLRKHKRGKENEIRAREKDSVEKDEDGIVTSDRGARMDKEQRRPAVLKNCSKKRLSRRRLKLADKTRELNAREEDPVGRDEGMPLSQKRLRLP